MLAATHRFGGACSSRAADSAFLDCTRREQFLRSLEVGRASERLAATQVRQRHPRCAVSSLAFSASDIESCQRCFTPIQAFAYQHQAASFGGSHWSGDFAPLERLADAATATRWFASSSSFAYAVRC